MRYFESRVAISPDLHALLRREEERIGWRGRERCVPGVEVANHRRAELRGTMRIGDQAIGELALAIEPPPDLRPAEEEALIAREAVQHGRRLAAERQLVCGVGDGEPGQISDIFAQ